MRIPVIIALCSVALAAYPQHVDFPDHAKQRGYYDAPWLRYEAEPGRCSGNATFLEAPSPYSQQPLQAEASNRIAAQLVNQGDYVEWTADADADGVTIRFSLPDSADGTGLKGNVGLYVNGTKVADIELDSYWAWQYTLKSGSNKYPDNTPAANKFARMRFDEKYILLSSKIPAGAKFSLKKEDANDTPYTVDFVELEAVPQAIAFESLTDADKVKYEGDGSTLQTFINDNPGKTIFLPAGRYEVTRRLQINSDNTKLIGAGMWHTIINFPASSDDPRTYSARGIESSRDGVRLEGVTLTTINNKRYYNNNSSYQVGKGLQGSWGEGSVIRDVRVEHFECGAWIADYGGKSTDGLLVTHCRFRNNYADGINLCSGTGNTTVSHCSFRNNGDDDMASWSTGHMAHGNEFCYNTAENNWRASSVGFFGGDGNVAHHILVIDAMESGVRVNGKFSGPGYDGEPCRVHNVTIRSSGCTHGTVGVVGDFWGYAQGAFHICGGSYYDVVNLKVNDIDIYGARGNGMAFSCDNRRYIRDIEVRNVTVHSAGTYGFEFIGTARGNGVYSNLTGENCGYGVMNYPPDAFDFVEDGSGIDASRVDDPSLQVNGCSVTADASVEVYTLTGALVKRSATGSFSLAPGVYVAVAEGRKAVKFVCR